MSCPSKIVTLMQAKNIESGLSRGLRFITFNTANFKKVKTKYDAY